MSGPGSHDRATLLVLEHVLGTQEVDEFARALLVGLHGVVPSDYVSLNGISQDPDEIWAITNPATPEHLFPEFQRLAFENPLIARLQRTQDGRAYRWSDTRDALGLTPREAEVLSAVIAGHSNQEAADDLGLSVRTVQKHLERAFRKLGVRSRTEATAQLLAGPPEPPPRPPITT